jgi:hypothetical protein
METKFSRTKTMKTNLLCKISSIICTLMFASFSSVQAATINSTYTGPTDGNWGDPANWSPAIVPNNGGGNTFAATIANVFLTLDLDVTVDRLTFNPGDGNPIIVGGTAPLLDSLDHNFTSAHTSVGDGGIVLAFAVAEDVTVDLGELADFSGTTLHTGYAYIAAAEPGRTATLKFENANIFSSAGGIELIGGGANITDEQGRDAITHFRHNLFDGYFDLEVGRNFTTEGSFVNEGLITVFASEPGFFSGDIDTTLTINGSYTGIGYPLDPNTDGQVELIAPGPDGDARMIINGALTNYNPARKTLNKTWYQWEAANGRSATTQVLGGSRPLDIVTNNASLSLFGPNTGFRDTAGNDALRNLAVSARFLMGDRDFTTADSFTSTSRLSIYGNSHFNVNGHLSVSGEQFQVFALTGYALLGLDGFPNDPPYKKSYITVRGSLDMRSVDRFRYGIFDNATLPSVTINGAAKLGGALVPYLLDGANVSASDRFTLMTAANMVGHFSNVANRGRVSAISFSDGSVLGTFLLTINRRSIVLSDFQPAQGIPESHATRPDSSKTLERGLDGNDSDL